MLKKNKEFIYDYSKFRGRVKELGLTMDNVAIAIGINPSTLSGKINNETDFKSSEMINICLFLDGSTNSLEEYFFCHKTLETQSFVA